MSPLILHLETSSRLCSVALSRGSELLALIESGNPYEHSAMLTPYIRDVMDGSGVGWQELEAVSVSAGPGSYTGLRVGVAAAKALCFARGIPLIAVDTLESLALAALLETDKAPSIIMPVLDARRMELYMALFDQDGRRLTPDTSWVIEENELAEIVEQGESLLICGEGLQKIRDSIGDREGIIYMEKPCSARYLIGPSLGRFERKSFEDPLYFTPHYLKEPNITVPRRKLV